MNDEEKKEYEARLKRRLEILKGELGAGNVKINSDLSVIEDLKAVRYGVDGEIDLATVKGSVRSLALVVEQMHERREIKKAIPLKDLQLGYFENIEKIFGNLYRDMERANATPFQVGSGVARDPEGVRIFHKMIPEVLSWVKGLWTEAHDIAHIHAEDITSLKSVFGGETFPQGGNIVSRTGIYVDTNILPDPFLRSQLFLEGQDREAAVRTLVTGGLSLLQYKEAALADIAVPLVAIIPDQLFLDDDTRERVFELARDDSVSHLSAMFGQRFESLEAARDFLKNLNAAGDVVAHLADKTRLLFDTDDTGPVESSIDAYIRKFHAPFGLGTNAGIAVISATVGRMRQANDLLYRSTALGGSPIIDAPTSWRYFNWKLGYNNTQTDPETRLNLHMTKALQNAASGEMEWLGAVPVQALIEMRKQDALPELRSMLSEGLKELIEVRPDNFFRTSDRVVENIQNAFDEHRSKLATLTGKKWRFAGVELGSCIVKGAVQVASALGVPVVSLVGAALDNVVDVPKLKDVPKRVRSLRDEGHQLKGSAVGMLFQVARNK